MIDLEYSIDVKEFYVVGESVPIKFTLENKGNQDIKFLTWSTPFDGIKSDIFKITKATKRIRYSGARYKRGYPNDNDYKIIKSGEKFSCQIDLTEGYEILEEGTYNIDIDFTLFLNDEEPKLYKFKSKSGTGKKIKVKAKKKNKNKELTVIDRAIRDALSSEINYRKSIFNLDVNSLKHKSHQEKILSLQDNLLNCIIVSKKHLERLGTREYIEWFGAFTQSRWNKVYFSYIQMYIILTSLKIEVKEGDKKECVENFPSYGYVGKYGTTTIYLCDNFWTMADCGRDSKLGFLIHELSHIACDTVDAQYPISACKRLATKQPETAVKNANNYEYFSEDLCCNKII